MRIPSAWRGSGLQSTLWFAIVVTFGAVPTSVPTSAFGGNSPGQAPATGDAFEQNRRLGRGVNVLGYDPIWKSPSEARFRAEYFRLIRQAGFDHVRVNLHPFRDAQPDGSLSPAYWQTLDWVVQRSLENHLAVVLDFHEFLDMAKDPNAKKGRFLDIWRQIAERYKHVRREVYFEILNEPHGKLTPALWNQFLREALAVIRKANPDRTVIIGPGQWNGINFLKDLDLPEDDRNLIVTVHFYEPFAFTHQGAPWMEYKDKVGVAWNGDKPQREAIARDFARAQAWAERRSRPLYLGEFGAYDRADMASRVRYLGCVARQAEKLGWSWAYWQFDPNFLLYDVSRHQWIRPLLDALIPADANQNFQASPP